MVGRLPTDSAAIGLHTLAVTGHAAFPVATTPCSTAVTVYCADMRRLRLCSALALAVALCLPFSAARATTVGSEPRPDHPAVDGAVSEGPQPATTVGSELRPGQRLGNGDRLVSPSGQRTIDLDRAVGEDPGLFVDTIGLDLSTDGCGPTYVDSTIDIELQHSTLQMQTDGNLVWYRGPYAIMHSGTAGNPGAFARMQNDGNFVVYSPAGHALWHLENPCTFIATSDFVDGAPQSSYLRPGWFMQDENRRYRLQMQTDGNLVLVGPRGRPLWNSRTHGNPGAFLAKQTDGNLVIYSAAGRALWSSRTGRPDGGDTYLAVQSNGNVALFLQDRPIWSTRTAGRR